MSERLYFSQWALAQLFSTSECLPALLVDQTCSLCRKTLQSYERGGRIIKCKQYYFMAHFLLWYTWYLDSHSLCVCKCLLHKTCPTQPRYNLLFHSVFLVKVIVCFSLSVYITFHSLLLHSHLMTRRLLCLICQKWKQTWQTKWLQFCWGVRLHSHSEKHTPDK